MAANRTKAQRESDRTETSRLYCTGLRQADIAARLGVAQSQVSYDLKAIFAEWSRERAETITAWTNEQLAKIDALEREYWDAWRRSCGEKTRTIKGASVTPSLRGAPRIQRTKAVETTEEMLGNPAYLAGVQWCISARVRILGLAVPTKVAPTTPDGANPYMGMPDDVLRAELTRYAIASGIVGCGALPGDDERPPEPTATV